MKKVLVVALVLLVLSPALAFAGASTDAALGLGAFAVFNQILSGTGIFGGLLGHPGSVGPVVVAPAPPVTVYQPAPVVYAPAPVVYAPAPVVYAPAPPVVIVRPQRIVGPRPGYHAPPPVYRYAPRPVPVARGWCPAGRMNHGRCY